MADIVSGICHISVNGQNYHLRGDVSMTGFTRMKEPIINLDGTVQVQTLPTVPKCSVTFTKSAERGPEFDMLESLGEGTSANLTIETQSGSHTYGDVFVQGEPTFDPEDGTVSVDFVAVRHTEESRRP